MSAPKLTAAQVRALRSAEGETDFPLSSHPNRRLVQLHSLGLIVPVPGREAAYRIEHTDTGRAALAAYEGK